MLSDSGCLKFIRLLCYLKGQHIILSVLLYGKLLVGAAWAQASDANLARHAPQRNDNLPDFPVSLTVNTETHSEPSTFPLADSYTFDPQGTASSSYVDRTHSSNQPEVLYLAAPENLNPGLYSPPPVVPSTEPVTPEAITPDPIAPDSENPKSDKAPGIPIWEIDGLTLNLSDDFSNFSQGNRTIEPTITGVLPNGDRLSVTTGLNRFTQPDIQTVFNLPLKVAWTGRIGDFTTAVSGGVDLFNRLPAALDLNANMSVPIGDRAVISFTVDHGPYKFNATTLNNQITAWRYGPDLYWQIGPDLSLFSLVRWGRYSDGNHEQQSFSRIEKKLGNFHVAGNLFTWSYREDAESISGYFSPPNFLVANAEFGWEGEVLEWLNCGVAASWGQQRLSSSWSSAYSYNTKCTLEITESLEMDLGYAFSNVIGQTGNSAFNNRAITGQVRAQF